MIVKNKEILIGYGRVSTTDKQQASLNNQKELLEEYGCEIIFFEENSGRNDQRKEFKKCINYCIDLSEKGYKVTLAVVKSDRLSRNFATLVTTVQNLNDRGIKFKSLTESFDTTTNEGRAMFNMLAVFAELEVATIRERIKMGMERAKKEGKHIGRYRNLDIENKVVSMYKESNYTVKKIADINKISERSVHYIIKRHNIPLRKDINKKRKSN